jgi:hypothetical protein
MIFFSQVTTPKALFEYSAGFGPGLRVWRLRAILRPQKSVNLKRQKAWF